MTTPDTVIVLSYDRPEMLALALEYLAAASGVREKQIVVSQDIKPRGPAPETLREVQQVLERSGLDIRYVEHQTTGTYNGENTILALREAHATGAERVFLVEDDTLVNADFFQFCTRALQQFESLPVVCHRGLMRCLLDSQFAQDPWSVCVTAGPHFKQLACAFDKETLGNIVRNIRPRPDKPFDDQMSGTFFLAPFVQRARDIGNYSSILHAAGNSVDQRPIGTLEEKTAEVRRRYSVHPVAPTKTEPTLELVLRLDSRDTRSGRWPGFKLVQRRLDNGRVEGPVIWASDAYVSNSRGQLAEVGR